MFLRSPAEQKIIADTQTQFQNTGLPDELLGNILAADYPDIPAHFVIATAVYDPNDHDTSVTVLNEVHDMLIEEGGDSNNALYAAHVLTQMNLYDIEESLPTFKKNPEMFKVIFESTEMLGPFDSDDIENTAEQLGYNSRDRSPSF